MKTLEKIAIFIGLFYMCFCTVMVTLFLIWWATGFRGLEMNWLL